MGRSATLPRRHAAHRTPIAAGILCLAVALPATALAHAQPVARDATVTANVVPPTPRLQVLYPDITTLFNQITPDGGHVYLDSPTDLVTPTNPVEAHQPWDVVAGVAKRIVPPQSHFTGLALVSPDGRSQVVYAGDPLTAVDDPGTFDLYIVHDGVPKLASAGTASDELVAKWLADDGSRVVFTSMDDIVPGDTHAGRDLYLYDANTNQISLVAPGIDDATFALASPNGQHILVGDPSGYFEKINGTATLRAKGTLTGFSADSSKVYFTTTDSLVPGDTDGQLDGYYSSSDGSFHLMDLHLDGLLAAPIELRISPDGSHWILGTDEPLSPADTDLTEDWYVGSAAGWTLIPGGLGTTTQLWTAPDDSTIVWTTVDAAVPGDTDGTADIYRWTAVDPGTTTILTDGTQTGAPTSIRRVSTDGTRVVFSTAEDLAAGDGDTAVDLYRWESGTLTLLSPSTPRDVTFDAASSDGRRVVFDSVDPILAADTNPDDSDHYISDEDTSAPTAAAPTWFILAGMSLNANGQPKLRIQWSPSSDSSGIARYEVAQSTDGGAFVQIASKQSPLLTDRFVSFGHTYRFRVRAVDNAWNTGTWATGPTTRISAVSQSSTAVKYAGSWTTVSSSAYWGGTSRASSKAGSTATYTFTGRAISWVGLKSKTRGKARIYINGVLKATVDLYSSTTLSKYLIWQATYSTSAKRTITIKVLGTAGRPRVDVDGFIVGS